MSKSKVLRARPSQSAEIRERGRALLTTMIPHALRKLDKILLKDEGKQNLTKEGRLYVDSLFGILDRAGLSIYTASKEQDRDLARLDAEELAAMREAIEQVLAARATPVLPAPDDAPDDSDAALHGVDLFSM